MPASVVQSIRAEGSGVTSVTATLASNVTAGNSLLLMSSAWEQSLSEDGLPGAVSSSPSGTWNTAVDVSAVTRTGCGGAATRYSHNATGGATSITASSYYASTYAVVAAVEVSGLQNAAPDVTATGLSAYPSATNTPATSSTATTSQADAIAFALLQFVGDTPDDDTPGWTTPTGYTKLQEETLSYTIQGMHSSYKVLSATGTEAPSWGTTTSPASWAASVALFKAAAGGGTTYNDTITGAVTGADTVSSTATFPNAFTDSVTAADTLSSTATFPNSLTDSGTAADTVSGGLLLNGSVSDAGTAADSLANAVVWGPSVSDSGTAGDSNSTTQTSGNAVSDGATAADTNATTATFPNSLTDSVTAADNVNGGGPQTYNDTITDGVTAGDSADGGPQPNRGGGPTPHVRPSAAHVAWLRGELAAKRREDEPQQRGPTTAEVEAPLPAVVLPKRQPAPVSPDAAVAAMMEEANRRAAVALREEIEALRKRRAQDEEEAALLLLF